MKTKNFLQFSKIHALLPLETKKKKTKHVRESVITYLIIFQPVFGPQSVRLKETTPCPFSPPPPPPLSSSPPNFSSEEGSANGRVQFRMQIRRHSDDVSRAWRTPGVGNLKSHHLRTCQSADIIRFE